MPSKLFHARPPSSSKSTVLFFSCLIIGIAGFIFGISATIAVSHGGYRCNNFPLRSVKVLWTTTANTDNDNDGLRPGPKRHKVMGFVGIQTGFGSAGRRRSLRKTWMPSDPKALQRLEEATGLAFRFVIGRTNDDSKMSALKKEVAEYDDFLILDINEEYSNLPHKTLAFFRAAYALFDSEFYVKADDDIYLRPGD